MQPRTRRRAGVTLVEIVVVIAIMTVSMAMFAQTLTASSRLDPVAHETMLAGEGARAVVERMRAQPFEDVFALYNTNPADDPGGPGTAPGSTFMIPGLAPATVGGVVGTVEFPAINGALRENVNDEKLGMPRDLDMDGLIDGNDHSSDYAILPMRIKVQWASATGRSKARKFEMYVMFCPL